MMIGYGAARPRVPLRARVRARLRRPAPLVEQTRRLFYLAVLFALALLLVPLSSDNPTTRPLLFSGAAALALVWTIRYRKRRSPVLLDMAEAAAAGAAAAAVVDFTAVYAFVFAAAWFRSLYGSTRRMVGYALFMTVGLLAAVPLWEAFPGRAEGTLDSAVLGGLAQLYIVMGVSRHLALTLFVRQQSQQRDAALMRLGHSLIGVGDRDTVHRLAGECVVALCAATPGLRAVTVLVHDGEQRVLDTVGEFRSAPSVLARPVLPADGGSATMHQLDDHGALDEAAGFDGTWLGIPLPEEPGRWILLGAPGRVPLEAVVAVRSMANQVALALRTSDVHLDLTTQASVDALTGLANRAAFTAVLDLTLEDPASRSALLFLDLDDFKLVNDGLGHAAGDELLRLVATRIRQGVRPDDLCARIGGDEFAVLLAPDDVAADGTGERCTAAVVAQRLVEVVATPVSLAGRVTHVAASVGLAFAVPGVTGQQLVQQADVAMYAAKAKGKNRVQVFDPSLLQEDGQVTFEAELAGAAAAGQLVVHYQPIISLPDQRCTAVEALVRWQHPTRGLLVPADFLATAERTGASIDIGAFVLRRACADAAGWSREHGPLAVHVNISATQLTDQHFARTVRSAVAEFGLAPRQLVLEIAESMLDSAAVRSALDGLVALDVAVAIDGFGIGYSTLTTLRMAPLDIIKIDKSFLDSGVSRAANEAVVEALVGMAERLGLQIVADGVERVEQQQFLARAGVAAVQGFLHLRPTPAEEFGAWLRERPPADRVHQGNVTRLSPVRPGRPSGARRGHR